MSLFDFFFPEEAQASHLRRIADSASLATTQSRLNQARINQQNMSANRRIQELEAEVAQLTLVMEAMIETLSHNIGLSREQIAQKISEIDLRDGVADGKITHQQPPEEPKKSVKFSFPKEKRIHTKA